MKSDTIVAIGTAMSNSSIGIIRVSGSESIEVVNNIYQSKNCKLELKDYDSHTINYGFIVDDKNVVDEVMVAIMKAPRSYTTEDTVEINCHGGILVMNKIVELVVKNGARVADPGEFTKRAFLNGRIDLSKAEAVMDVIQAKSDMALKNSLNQLSGMINTKIKELRSKIIYEIAFIESALDDPEHISTEGYPKILKSKVEKLLLECNRLLKSTENGKILKDGIDTVILGKPNVGKSSLLNLMVGEDRAIVTNIPGTTRDILEESIRVNGVELNLIDTAGIRDTEDEVEKIGVSKAKKYAEDADLILFIIDASIPLDSSDEEIFKMIGRKKTIILLNKSDLDPIITEDGLKEKLLELDVNKNDVLNSKLDEIVIVSTSVKKNIGIDIFEKVVENLFFKGDIYSNDEIIITNIRHKDAISSTIESLEFVISSIELGMAEDFLSIDLMSAYGYLGYIIGEEVEEDLVNEIFSKFCMGK